MARPGAAVLCARPYRESGPVPFETSFFAVLLPRLLCLLILLRSSVSVDAGLRSSQGRAGQGTRSNPNIHSAITGFSFFI